MTLVFKKNYDGSSLSNIGRDVYECFITAHNQAMYNIPTDERGVPNGVFKVIITWVLEEDE